VKVSVLFQIHMELLTLILLTLSSLVSSLSPVSSHVSCVFMETCLLPCSFKPGDLVIEWKKLEGSVTVHVFDQGKDELKDQDASFRGRTSLFPEQFFVGNTSMQLFKVTLDDEGIYRCFVYDRKTDDGTEEYIHLRVEGKKQALSMEQKGDVLVCSSEGIYPQPNVSWAPPSRHKTQIKPMTDRRFSVTSSLSLDVQPPQQYSCNISTDHSWKSATYSLQRECAPVHSVRAPLFYTSSHQQEVNQERGWGQDRYYIIFLSQLVRCLCVSDSCDVSLDPNTAHRCLLLSEDRRTVSCGKEQQYPDHEDRFTDLCQVLSSTGLRGRCYWEVDWSGEDIDIAVSYRGIRRRGYSEESRFGDNDQSWSLRIKKGEYSVLHNERAIIEIRHSSAGRYRWDVPSGKVGVFLDSEAGALSFYRIIKGDLIHFHTFSSSFTEPLFPGFGLDLTSKLSVV
uniref:Uncharacterized protein n=1 Tax=Neogobius melanostomus TaxID=47308 RepID=A0A8C6SPI9_9GOBI